jgi:hypothetical protein
MLKSLVPLVAAGLVLAGAGRSNAQALVTVDPTQLWVGYMNVSTISGGYEFGTSWGTSDLRAGFTNGVALLRPCTNVWETTDTYWVQGDGLTPNALMDANFYVETSALVNTNVVFMGVCLSNTLTANPEPLSEVSYTSVAFLKAFDSGYGLISSATTNLIAGQAFTISLNTTGAAHVQYGFETIGPDANPATASALGNVQVAEAAPAAEVTVDPSQSWVGYMNVFNLPAAGGGYMFGSAWGPLALQAVFTGTSLLTLSPCTNVWETTDTYWVQADQMTPNKINDASMYVQNDSLINSNVVFVGTCVDNSLTTSPEPLTGVSYTSVAFIKAFNSGYGVIASVTNTLVAGQSWGISLNTAGAAHVQYGFETVGPDANPTSVGGLGQVDIMAGIPPSPLQVPTNNAPVPARPAGAVLCMYDSCGAYPCHPIERWLSSWSSATESLYTNTVTHRVILEYKNLQYAGVEFYDTNAVTGAGGDNVGGTVEYAINATAYDTLHVDVWTPTANQFGVQIASLNPTIGPQVDFLPASGTITNNGWIGLDIPLSSFTAINPSLDLSDLQQLLWIDNEGGGGVTGGIFYIDNVYFYNSSMVAQPSISGTMLGGNLQLSFATDNTSSYTVQYKTNLTDSVWQTLSTVSGNGSTQTVADPKNQQSRFYRLWVH